MRRSAILLLSLGLSLAVGGCLSAPEAPPPVRYFSLEGRPAGEPSSVAEGLPLRLKRARAAAFLGEKVVWRRSDVEVGFYEDRRWAEPPAALIERALASELFVASRIARGDEKAPTLDVTLTAFEELVEPRHEARVTLVLLLKDAAGRRLIESTVSEGEPIPNESAGDPTVFARAMDRALGAALRGAGRAVSAALAAAARERPAG